MHCNYDSEQAPVDLKLRSTTFGLYSLRVMSLPPSRIDLIDPIPDVSFSFSTTISASHFRVARPRAHPPAIPPRPDGRERVLILQVETGGVTFGKAVRNFLTRAPLIDTKINLRRRLFSLPVNSFETRIYGNAQSGVLS